MTNNSNKTRAQFVQQWLATILFYLHGGEPAF